MKLKEIIFLTTLVLTLSHAYGEFSLYNTPGEAASGTDDPLSGGQPNINDAMSQFLEAGKKSGHHSFQSTNQTTTDTQNTFPLFGNTSTSNQDPLAGYDMNTLQSQTNQEVGDSGSTTITGGPVGDGNSEKNKDKSGPVDPIVLKKLKESWGFGRTNTPTTSNTVSTDTSNNTPAAPTITTTPTNNTSLTTPKPSSKATPKVASSPKIAKKTQPKPNKPKIAQKTQPKPKAKPKVTKKIQPKPKVTQAKSKAPKAIQVVKRR